MTAASTHKGHCRCGSVAMHAAAAPDFSVYCHCDDCRRSCGAPVIASVGFQSADIIWDADETLLRYQNGTATRLFCSRCGSPVAQQHESAAEKIFFNTGFMDDPAAYPPTYHTFSGEQLPWLELSDDLPRADRTLIIKT